MEVDEQIDKLRATSNDNLALSFPKTQAWMLMRSRMQPTLYFPEYICSHHLRRHGFTHRQQGQDNKMPLHHGVHSYANRYHQSMVHYRLCLMANESLTNNKEQLSAMPLDNQG